MIPGELKANLGYCFNAYPPSFKVLFYKYIDQLLKAKKIKLQMEFLSKCHSNKVIPKSLRTNNSVQSDLPFPSSSSAILSERIDVVHNQMHTAFGCSVYFFKNFLYHFHLTCLTPLNLTRLLDYAHMYVDLKISPLKIHLLRKFDRIFKSSPWSNTLDNNLILNLSSYELNYYEKVLLNYGISFAINDNPNPLEFLISFDTFKKNNLNNFKNLNFDILKGILLANFNNNFSSMPKIFIATHNKLSNNKDIIITRSDKGKKIVIMDTDNYTEKANALLNDITVYELLSSDPLKNSQSLFNKNLKLILKDYPNLSKLFSSYLPTISRFYGLPKTHKINIPLRPIISNTNSVTFRLSSWLSKTLSSLVGTISDSHLRNSEDFVSRISNIDLSSTILVSYDVVSLFTNVPVNVCLQWLENYIISKNILFEIPFATIKSLILLTMDHSFFSFNDRFFKQKKGLSMGSPLSPILSNIYMELFELKFFEVFPNLRPLKWLRYVDDIFAILPNSLSPHFLLDCLNDFSTIDFTIECETSNCIPFLDVLVSRSNNRPTFKIYRKPTFTPSYIHWFSSHSLHIKRNILIDQFLRAYRLSSPQFLDEELQFLTQIFKNIKYPHKVIISALHKAKKKFYINTIQTQTKSKAFYLPLNFDLDNKTKTFLKASLPPNLHFTYSNNIHFKRSFIPKNSCEVPCNAGVYSIPCGDCEKQYIGESNDIKRRTYQHDYSLRTEDNTSSLVLHRSQSNHRIKLGDLKVLSYQKNTQKRKLIESFCIKNFENYNSRPPDVHIDDFSNHILRNDFRCKKLYPD